jgi:pimeloyl-ACP methyl ester carboxylesterase
MGPDCVSSGSAIMAGVEVWSIGVLRSLRLGVLVLGVLNASAAAFCATAANLPRFEPTTCWFEAADALTRCGFLFVPENRQNPTSAELRLPIVRIAFPAKTIAADPILFINGGPGGDSGLREGTIASWWRDISQNSWMNEREMILMDQRGSGLASPSLNCPEFDTEAFSIAYDIGDEGGAWQSEMLALGDSCRDRLLAEGRDLAAYNSVAAADDVADLQKLLAIEALNVYAASYGTRIALTLMRDHPEAIRSVILESVVPMDVDFMLEQQGSLARSIEKVAAGCAADRDCAARYPDLGRRFAERLRRLDEAPVEIRITDPVNLQEMTVEVNGGVLQESLLHVFYGGEEMKYLPNLIHSLIKGDDAFLADWIQRDAWGWYGSDVMSEGAYLSFVCSENVPFTDLSTLEAEAARYPAYNAGGIVGYQDVMMCPHWPVGAVAVHEREPVTSAIPTLLLSGDLDPVTPPAFADRAAQSLSNSFNFVIPGAGHTPLTHSSCANEIAEEFLNNPQRQPAAACLPRLR